MKKSLFLISLALFNQAFGMHKPLSKLSPLVVKTTYRLISRGQTTLSFQQNKPDLGRALQEAQKIEYAKPAAPKISTEKSYESRFFIRHTTRPSNLNLGVELNKIHGTNFSEMSNTSFEDAFFNAINKEDIKHIHALLIQCPYLINVINTNGESPLLIAIKKNNPEFIKQMLSYKPSITIDTLEALLHRYKAAIESNKFQQAPKQDVKAIKRLIIGLITGLITGTVTTSVVLNKNKESQEKVDLISELEERDRSQEIIDRLSGIETSVEELSKSIEPTLIQEIAATDNYAHPISNWLKKILAK